MKFNSNEVYDFISDLIQNDKYSVYRNRAATKATAPYITIKLDTKIDTSPSFDQMIIFAIYEDENKSIRNIEEIADAIEYILNKNTFESDTQRYHFMLSLRQNIPNEMLISKQAIELQFMGRIYPKKGE